MWIEFISNFEPTPTRSDFKILSLHLVHMCLDRIHTNLNFFLIEINKRILILNCLYYLNLFHFIFTKLNIQTINITYISLYEQIFIII